MPKVRIIGGEWRSRRINFPDIPGLRPSLDRIRETLFNWLMPFLPGAQCLDLFAGSGVLGFEALSRGAQFCCFVDSHPEILKHLRETAHSLSIAPERHFIVRGHVPKKIPALPNKPYDIIFLDPPFHENLLMPSISWLIKTTLLSPHTLIYMEMEKHAQLDLPCGWEIYRKQESARLIYQLIQCC